jgi:putative PIG3 family NAD(P)H quinone oxidoreductase
MRAVVCEGAGGVEVLKIGEIEDPTPEPDSVVIDVVAAGVNRADLLQRQGNYPPPPGAPGTLGLECSGVISAVGENVEDWSVGDECCALLAGGGYAEKVGVPAAQLLPVPAGLSLQEAAALPEVACTVWSNTVEHDRLHKGETLLVHGGGSGIGSFAIQLGKALGATVIATARSVKHDEVRALGADLVIDYSTDDFVAVTKDFTGGRGADVVLDIIGAKYLARNLDVLATNGRLSVIGMQGGTRAELDLGKLMAKRGTISSTSLRARPPAEKARIVSGVAREVDRARRAATGRGR